LRGIAGCADQVNEARFIFVAADDLSSHRLMMRGQRPPNKGS
jgi:hypothetical protein